MEHIEKRYADWYHRSGYFAAVCKHTLFAYAIEDKEEGSFIL